MVNDDDFVSLLISTQAEKAGTTVLEFLRREKVTDVCYAFKYRVKSPKDLVAKRDRKVPEKPGYQITSITDVIGIRMVTLFKGDMLLVYANLLALLSRDASVTSPLYAQAPEEVIVYKGSSALEEFPEEIRKITKNCFPACEVVAKTSKEGYSSIHVICRHSEPIDSDKLSASRDYRIPLEIQIRTVFEDAWGEIDHKYGYVIREGKDAGTPIGNPKHVEAHLKVLKDFTDACMDYAECIRNEAQPESLNPAQSTSQTISVESDGDVLKRLNELGMPSTFIQAYVDAKARHDQARAIVRTDANRATSTRAFLDAAELFREAGLSVARETEFEAFTEGERLGYYYCAMNEALCLLSTNQSEQVSIALDRYLVLASKYKSYPLVRMRLGQAFGKVGRYDEAIAMLKFAKEQSDKLGTKSISTGRWLDSLPRADYEHICYTLPKILGFVLWQKSQELPETARTERAGLYQEAYNVTLACLEVPNLSKERERDAYNNLIYYGIGCLNNTDVTMKATDEMRSEVIKYRERLLALEHSVDALPVIDVDTLFRASAVLGEGEKARSLATRLVVLCLRDQAGVSPTTRLSLAEAAQAYLETGKLIAL